MSSQFGFSEPIYSPTNLQSAYILSLAGIIPVGKKASLIFDSMLFLNQK